MARSPFHVLNAFIWIYQFVLQACGLDTGATTDLDDTPGVYEYTALGPNELTRILLLSPATDPSEPLHGEVIHAEQASTLNCTAMSYAWGKPDHVGKLLIGSRNKYLPITQSLDEMLRELRDHFEVQRFWIDAVCIDQRNDKEKARQVRNMATIYEIADHVVVWVGADYYRGTKVLEFLDENLANLVVFCDDYPLGPPLNRVFPDKAKATAALEENWDLKGDDDDWDVSKIQLFFQRPWFTRRWVIQEVISANRPIIRCGSKSMDFADFVIAAERASTYSFKRWGDLKEFHNPASLRNLEVVKAMMNRNACLRNRKAEPDAHAYKIELLELLNSFHTARCSDGRDRIFALVGLAHDVVRTFGNVEVGATPKPSGNQQYGMMKVVLDYGRSVEDTYMSFAISLLETGTIGLRSLLHYAGAFSKRGKDNLTLPTWVPDWTQRRIFAPVVYKSFHTGPLDQDLKIHVSEDLKTLHIKGYKACHIASRCGMRTGGMFSSEVHGTLQAWWDCFATTKNRSSPLPHGSWGDGFYSETWPNAYYETFFTAVTLGNFDDLSVDFLCSLVKPRDRSLPGWSETADALKEPLESDDEEPFKEYRTRRSRREQMDRLSALMTGRAVGTTNRGEFIVFPLNAENGDVVAVFPELDTPFVLRLVHKEGSLPKYKLIGDCYLQGKMHYNMSDEFDELETFKIV